MLFTNGLQQVGLQGLPEWRLLHARVREGRGRTRFNVPSCADMDESPPCSQAAPVLFLVARNRNEESGELSTKRLCLLSQVTSLFIGQDPIVCPLFKRDIFKEEDKASPCLLYTSDAADEEDSVDLGGRRI